MIKEYLDFIKEYLKIAELKTSYLVINLLSAFFYKGFSIALPFVLSLMIKYLTIKDNEMCYFCLALFVVISFLYLAALYINYKIYAFNASYCYTKLNDKVMQKLIHVDQNFTRYFSKGRLMNSINSDILAIGDMNDEISEITMGIIQIVAVLIIVATVNIFLCLLFVIFSLVYITLRNNADRKINYYHNKVKANGDKYSTLLTQIISGLQEIKTFNMAPKLVQKLSSIQKSFTKNYTIKRHYYTIRDNDTKIVTYACRFFLYLLLILLITIGKSDVSILVLIISYHEYLVEYINDFIASSSAIRETSTAVTRMNEILNYNAQEIHYGELDTNSYYEVLSLKNVSLTIEKKEVLKNINLRIDHNEVIAIVGEAGAGKTMLFNLLLRLYEPTKGKIKLDNINIFDFSEVAYSKIVSVVNQKPFIFNMSIRKNLNFVDTNIKHQVEACKKAGIHEFIETLPNGYKTILRENGSNISGGQKQMISIARTILSGAEVLLLDDITTSLDPDTATLVPKLINSLKEERTILMITKKPDLMKLANRIVVLDKGSIVNVGTHEQLMSTSEIYQTLQSRKSPSRTGVFDHDKKIL